MYPTSTLTGPSRLTKAAAFACFALAAGLLMSSLATADGSPTKAAPGSSLAITP